MMRKRALVAMGGGYRRVMLATPAVEAMARLGWSVDVLIEGQAYGAETLLSGWDRVESIYQSRQTLAAHESGRGYDAVIRTAGYAGPALELGPELPGEAEEHEALANLSGTRAAGYDGPAPEMHVEADAPIWPLPERFIVIAPGVGGGAAASRRAQEWPHWQELCQRLRDRTGLPVLALGEEEDSRWWMRNHRPWLINFCGRTSIRGAAGVIGQCERLFAADNALALIGAALGRPTTTLLTLDDLPRRCPLGKQVTALSAERVSDLRADEALESAWPNVERAAG